MTDEQIIEALATKVMGWVKSTPNGLNWVLPDGTTGRSVSFLFPWNPLTNPADSKMVREKLAERCKAEEWYWVLNCHGSGFQFSILDDEGFEKFYGEADTEERAVALCALKTVGISL